MSHRSYNELWRRTQLQLQQQLAIEQDLIRQVHQVAFDEVASLYLHYLTVLRSMDECYDQIVHPQKRILLRRLLDQTIGRILELKQELVRLDLREVQFYDHLLLELGLQPEATEVTIPKYFLRERQTDVEERKRKFTEIYKTLGYIGEEEVKEEELMTFQDAVLLVQKCERARHGRARAALMRVMRRSQISAPQRVKVAMDPNMAATKIQRVYRGHQIRILVEKLRKEEMIFLGMIPPDPLPEEDRPQRAAIENAQRRREIQKQFELNYEKAVIDIRANIAVKESYAMTEQFQNEIRNWFTETK